MSEQQTPPKKSVLTSSKLVLTAPAPGQPYKKATLNVDVWKGDVSINVRTNDPNDVNNGNIRAGMDLATFSAFCEMLSQSPTWENKTKMMIECKGKPTFVDGKRGPQPVLTRVYLGKDENGCIYMSVTDAQVTTRPMIKFVVDVTNRDKYHVVHKNGTELSEADRSCLWAKGLANTWMQIVPQLCNATYEPQVFTPGGGKPGGGKQWNNNRQGGNGGGGYGNNNYQKTAQLDEASNLGDNDLPF